MAKVIITLRSAPDGSPVIEFDYESEPGDLAYEHERDHRRIVAQAMGMSPEALEASGMAVVRAAPAAQADEGAERAAEPAGAARRALPTRGNPGAPPARPGVLTRLGDFLGGR